VPGVLGVGIDVCSVDRMARALARTPSLGTRLFTPGELAVERPERLAARYAAKEAVAKALGSPWAGGWHDVEVVVGVGGAPSLVVRGGVLAAGQSLGVANWHVSLSHDAGIATAVVVLSS
jgi:holo-[acyl-carrier protein] synthase